MKGFWSSANIKESSYEKGYRSCAKEKDAEIAELVDMLEELLQEYNDTYSPDELNAIDALIAKHKGE